MEKPEILVYGRSETNQFIAARQNRCKDLRAQRVQPVLSAAADSGNGLRRALGPEGSTLLMRGPAMECVLSSHRPTLILKPHNTSARSRWRPRTVAARRRGADVAHDPPSDREGPR